MFLMEKEQATEAEVEYDRFKQSVFAHAFSAFDPNAALKQYYETFEKKDKHTLDEHDYQYDEFEPQDEQDVLEMINSARRLGVIK